MLARRLNYDREVIRVWFCNKRQALKNRYGKIKSNNESSAADGAAESRSSSSSSTSSSPTTSQEAATAAMSSNNDVEMSFCLSKQHNPDVIAETVVVETSSSPIFTAASVLTSAAAVADAADAAAAGDYDTAGDLKSLSLANGSKMMSLEPDLNDEKVLSQEEVAMKSAEDGGDQEMKESGEHVSSNVPEAAMTADADAATEMSSSSATVTDESAATTTTPTTTTTLWKLILNIFFLFHSKSKILKTSIESFSFFCFVLFFVWFSFFLS
jgi:hypothetical protein